MKKLQIICLLGIFLALGFKSFAQSNRIPLSENSSVKDSTGTVYAYEKWFPLISKGKYKLQKVKDANDEYLLVAREKLSADANKAIYGKNSSNYIGKQIKFSKMKDLDGDVYDDEFLKDKIVVLNFWFVRCAPCIKEIPELNNLYKRYKENQRVVFIAIGLDDENNIFDFLKSNPFYYKIIPSGRDLALDFNIDAYPTNLVIENGVVQFSKIAYSSKNISDLENVVQKLVGKVEK